MRRSLKTLVLVLLLEASCAPSRDFPGLRSVLARESKNDGVALAGVLSDEIAILPFDQKERFFKTQHGRAFEAFAKYGTMIAWTASSLPNAGAFVFEEMNGRQFTPAHVPPLERFRVTALNERHDKLALQAETAEGNAPVRLCWSTMDFTDLSFITEQSQTDVLNEMDWSPDGGELVYEKNATIFVFDIRKQTARVIGSGHDPTWSPTSDVIAYRGLNGQAFLVLPNGVKRSWPLEDHKILGPLRWSPNGLYVSFVEENRRHIPLIGAYSTLVIARVADGATVSVKDFGAGNGHTQIFHWIVNYQSFCKECPTGEEFN